MVDLSFSFTDTCWLWQAEKAAWHFVTLPEAQSDEIQFFNDNNSVKKRGWGAVKVKATIGKTSWQTSIFPHKASKAYILPIKADVRKAEKNPDGSNGQHRLGNFALMILIINQLLSAFARLTLSSTALLVSLLKKRAFTTLVNAIIPNNLANFVPSSK